jgi:hypothetical protein
VLFGGLDTPVSIAIIPVITEAKVPFMGPWAAGTPITHNGTNPNFAFRVSAVDETVDKAMLQYAQKTFNAKKPGLILVNNPWGESNEKGLKAAMAAKGVTPAGIEKFEGNDIDVVPQLTRLKNAGADSLFLVGNVGPSAQVVKSLDRMGWKPPIVSHWGPAGGRFTELAGPSAPSVHFVQTYSLFGNQRRMRVDDLDAPGLLRTAERLAEDVAEIDHGNLGIGHARDFERRHAPGILHLELDLLFVELARAQGFAERIARRSTRLADQRIEDAFLGAIFRLGLDFAAAALTDLGDADLQEIANDLLDVAPDIADLGELGGLDLDERRAREPREPARNLGLADAGRADHQDVFRQYFLAQLVVKLEAAPAVAQRDRDRALGVGLSDDILVKLPHDLARGQLIEQRLVFGSLRGKIDDH